MTRIKSKTKLDQSDNEEKVNVKSSRSVVNKSQIIKKSRGKGKTLTKEKVALSEKNLNDETMTITKRRGRSKKIDIKKDTEKVKSVLKSESDGENSQNEEPKVREKKGQKRIECSREENISKKMKVMDNLNLIPIKQSKQSRKKIDLITIPTDVKSKLKIKLNSFKQGKKKKNKKISRAIKEEIKNQILEYEFKSEIADDIDEVENKNSYFEAYENTNLLQDSITNLNDEIKDMDSMIKICSKPNTVKIVSKLDKNDSEENSDTESSNSQKSYENIMNVPIVTKKEELKSVSPICHYNINEDNNITCNACKQNLNNIKFYTGEPNNGHEEELALLDSKLSVFTGNEENLFDEDMRAYNKVTVFSVYCQNGHLCPFDSGMIERDIELYFSGHLKSICNDDSSINDSVPVKRVGPIVMWWVTGFDIGEQPTLAFSTASGDYILMKPSKEYSPYMEEVIKKVMMSKIVIEYLIYKPDANYEDLMAKLETTPFLQSAIPDFTDDILLQNASFICDQVMSFDDTAKLDEPLLIVAPSMRHLINLAGITFDCHKSRKQKMNRGITKPAISREKLRNNKSKNDGLNSMTINLIDKLLPNSKALSPIRKSKLRLRCGVCQRCLRSNCNDCIECKRKNYDFCVQRRCFYTEIQEANNKDARVNIDYSKLNTETNLTVFIEMIKTIACSDHKYWWNEPLVATDSGRTYYKSFNLNGKEVTKNSFVFVRSVNPKVDSQIIKVIYMWKDEKGVARFHGNLLWHGKDTILGDLANKKEIFFVNKCINMPVSVIYKKAFVFERLIPNNWEKEENNETRKLTKGHFFCQKSYDPDSGRFQDLSPPNEIAVIESKSQEYCDVCNCMLRHNEINTPMPIERIEKVSRENDEDRVNYAAVKYRGERYSIGSCVYLKPKSLYFKHPMMTWAKKYNSIKKYNEEKYPEMYKKSKEAKIDVKLDIPPPFDIGYVTKLFTINNKLYIQVKKFYRPINTLKGENLCKQSDMNMLFWSDEECTMAFSQVVGKCYVSHVKKINCNIEDWTALGPDRFYFSSMYKNDEIKEADKNIFNNFNSVQDKPTSYFEVTKLKTLDLFAGCGGFSLGLSQAGIADCQWAIESNEAATFTYKINIPKAEVIVHDCDDLIKKIVSGVTELNDQLLPKKGEVELICCSLSHDNFQNINNIEDFKKTRIATFLSYCNYYKPSYFILEADKMLIKRSYVLKSTLSCIIGIGYQVAFDLMQAGNFGVPQNKQRTIVLGAAPGLILPMHPKSLHVFPKSLTNSVVVVDNKKYIQENAKSESAPYRLVTIFDAISDLSNLVVVNNNNVVNYKTLSRTHYQKMMRSAMLEPTLFDHTCKNVGILEQTRMLIINLAPHSDWRDLPNIELKLKDGSLTKKLVYRYDDLELGRTASNAYRGVCKCSTGKKCDPNDRQDKTLIPWYLVHSGKRYNHWAGLYGRLEFNSVFNGITTNPELLGTQGAVIHPNQPRVISIRECARAQGFPDDFVLAQDISIHEKYRQIGSATSPLLARAIGREIASCISNKSKN